MENRLILVEGIPGSGKTMISRKIKHDLESKGEKAILYNEGDVHPADLAWHAYISLNEFERIVKEYPKYKTSLIKYTQIEENFALVAYTKLGIREKELFKYFEEHEVYDGRVPFEVFKKLHFKRWTKFVDQVNSDSIIIFECAYLQNHINELFAFHNKDRDNIIKYMLELINIVKKLKPILIYLSQPDVGETISRVAKERVSPDKSQYEDWIDLVISYVEKSMYGKLNNLKNFDGAIKFFEHRKKLELAVIEQLPIDKVVIENPDYNWEKVFNKIKSLW
ncbi:thymidylate kinase [Mycoplasmatota bacterium]|nr:thymidylate kinase [Mycoplasmatota bacterium]